MHTFIIGTRKCNLNCDFCIDRDNELPFKLDRVLSTLSGLLDNDDPYNVVKISGGEPLCDMEYLNGILEVVAPHKDKTDLILFTNGQLLTYDVHIQLLAGGRSLLYLLGVSPVPYKNMKVLLANENVMRIFNEGQARFMVNYVIDNIEHLPTFVNDAKLMNELCIPYKVGYNKNQTSGLSDIYPLLRGAVKESGYKQKPRYLDGCNCGSITIMPDGSTSMCESYWSEDQRAYAEKYTAAICAKCTYRDYCLNCPPMLIKYRFAPCCITKAMCANVF